MASDPFAFATTPEHDVRAALDAWGRRGLLREKKLGTALAIRKVETFICVTMRLNTECEARSRRSRFVPYKGEALDALATPPGTWDLAIPGPSEFADLARTVKVPGTDRVVTCGTCAGHKAVRCEACSGSGSSRCPACGGNGSRQVSVWVERSYDEYDHHLGYAVRKTHKDLESRYEACGRCSGGQVSCRGCGGDGKVTCPACEGRGRVKTFDVVEVVWKHCRDEGTINPMGVPGRKLHKVSGVPLFSARQPSFSCYNGPVPEINREVDRFLATASANHAADGRVRFQHLNLERIYVDKVRYARGRGQEKVLWMFGAEGEVHTSGLPLWAWGRVAGLGAAVGLGLLLLLVWAAGAQAERAANQAQQAKAAQAEAERLTRYTAASIALRSGPGRKYKALKVLPPGTPVRLEPAPEAPPGPWVKVVGLATTGWIDADHLRTTSITGPPSTSK